MGCDSQGSNFNNRHYSEGQWWCTSGWDYSLEGPLFAIREYLKDYSVGEGPTFVRKGVRWSIEQRGADEWYARPMGEEAELAEQEAQLRAEEARKAAFRQWTPEFYDTLSG